MITSSIYQQWFSNTRKDLLSGLVVALALIPEAIAFSIIAGVDPKVGLYASFSMAVVIAFAGGRPAMISAATGAMALLMITLVKSHGLDYLLAATLLTGVLQILAGYFKLGALMRFVPTSVVIGFVNALAILIFMAQLPELTNVTWHVYALVAAGLAIIYLFPYVPMLGQWLPSPLVCIVGLTLFTYLIPLDLRTVGDMGELPDTLPIFFLPDIPWNLETLRIIFPYALAMMIVGLLESMMTAAIVDELTDTTSDKNRECKGQGLANIVTGCMGGMAGCAMIGQSMINVRSGGRTRLSTLCAGLFLILMVVFLSDWIKSIPMAALVAVMVMVSISTFSWDSIRDLPKTPLLSNLVMLTTVGVVIYTHNLAFGVISGVILAMIFFAYQVEKSLTITHIVSENGRTCRYAVTGQMFFSAAEKMQQSFDFKAPIDHVIIDVHNAHLWDVSALQALDKIIHKFLREHVSVRIEGLNPESVVLMQKFSDHDPTIFA
ncbi:Putative sulfate transporter ybaR [Wohlfahrtiimonas chitiniclastica SH04]|uniref:Putative sulfate transporter ybaR n=1 Tax=Wohlfahrtiimonas chitiniclastica SH04 TaxID=1261130 RepID=L8XU42_9GAMM|nr:Putative sulfate transporter ybaR [Wohlfahrtiimonas chitiniclastica SH04]